VASVLVNGFFAWHFFKSDDIDRTPPWHPFELNSELTLESIVEDGYKFGAMPCGQVQYYKEVGDTYIQYEVEVDCESYDGHYERDLKLIDEEIVSIEEPRDSIEAIKYANESKSAWEEEIAANKYYPWNIDEIDNCYQKVNWRYFSKSLGHKIDSLELRDYVRSNGGFVMATANDWNASSGGAFMVSHSDSELYFQCFISNENFDEVGPPEWKLSIVGRIPALNQEVINNERIRQAKKDEFYRQ